MEMFHGKFTAMLWNTGIHYMADGGSKVCENDHDNFIIMVNFEMTMI